MAPLSNSARFKVAFGLLACCLLSLWLMGVPDTLTAPLTPWLPHC